MNEFGGRIRVPVVMTIRNVAHRTTICDMGLGPMLGIPGSVRRAAGVDRGAHVIVSIDEDKQERTVTIPADLNRAMTAAERRVFDGMAYSHRKEYVLWIEDAKKPDTRARRVDRVREQLRERQKS